MQVTKAGLFLIILIVVLSVLIGNFLNLISVEFDVSDEEKLRLEKLNSGQKKAIGAMDGTSKHLMWFVQISDLHLSIFQDGERTTELLEFCDITLKQIGPKLVLASGDLTDAKKQDLIGSTQFKEEWIKYRDVLNRCGPAKTLPWLDIRGNHDNFDVPSINSSRNYFRNYSRMGRRNPRSYLYKTWAGADSYAFIGVDACPAMGLRRPFNFIGFLQDEEMALLNNLAEAAQEADYTIWFGHYPTSCILSHHPGLKSVIASVDRSLAYLCGHFHSMLGFVPHMYTIQKSGFLELELADWKDNRMYRVGAVDHGLFSFIDVRHRDWPVILVTNPKHALYQSSLREPLSLMAASSHIRMLVFSLGHVATIRVWVDDEKWEPASRESPSSNLFVVPWNPSRYKTGIHYIKVYVLDSDGRSKTISHPFSLDGSRTNFKFLPRVLLMLSFTSVMQVMYGIAMLSCVLPYCFFRYTNRRVLARKKPLPVLKNHFAHRWLRRIWVLSNINTFFYPIILYPLYISVGPWALAELLEGQYGVIFIWGTIVNGNYVPETFTYGYAFLQLFLFHGPLVSFTAYSLDKRLLELSQERVSGNKTWPLWRSLLGHLPYFVLLSSQLLMAYAFFLAYGPLAVLLGPIRLWPIALVLWVWYQSSTISAHKMRLASRAWRREPMSSAS